MEIDTRRSKMLRNFDDRYNGSILSWKLGRFEIFEYLIRDIIYIFFFLLSKTFIIPLFRILKVFFLTVEKHLFISKTRSSVRNYKAIVLPLCCHLFIQIVFISPLFFLALSLSRVERVPSRVMKPDTFRN